jgi:hypothetical protein
MITDTSACMLQAMVYGNFNDNSGTGVCFTRNPATGEHALFGEFLVNAQGEDVVAGVLRSFSPHASGLSRCRNPERFFWCTPMRVVVSLAPMAAMVILEAKLLVPGCCKLCEHGASNAA